MQLKPIHLPKERFLRHGVIIMIICAVVLLGIGIFMFINGGASSGYMWPRYANPVKTSITWHTPVFAGLLFMLIAICGLFCHDKQTAKEKRSYLFDEIKYFLQADGFRIRGNHFFKRNGDIGYCVNIQNYRWNDSEQIRFTMNIGIFTGDYWLQHLDFKHTGVIPNFPKEHECAIRYRIGELLPESKDKWYSINTKTSIDELWKDLEQDLTKYIVPFFSNYNKISDVVQNQYLYRKRGESKADRRGSAEQGKQIGEG